MLLPRLWSQPVMAFFLFLQNGTDLIHKQNFTSMYVGRYSRTMIYAWDIISNDESIAKHGGGRDSLTRPDNTNP